MAFEFKLPDIGEGTVEGEIVAWLVSEGDEVTEDQPIVEVSTDKATVEITSPRDGVIQKILWEAGDVVPVGDVLVVIGGDGADEASETQEEEEEEEEVEEKDEKKEPARASSSGSTQRSLSSGNGDRPVAGKVLAAPATRRIAREENIDLTRVEGSGPRGRITMEDVKQVIAGTKEEKKAPTPRFTPEEAPSIPAGEREERIPFRGVRKAIADQMTRSWHYSPHFTYVDDCDVTKLVEFRKEARQLAEEKGIKLTYLPFITKAIIGALKRHPEVNAAVDEEAREVVRKNYHNIGIAVATDKGLMVPVVKEADGKSVFEIAGEIGELAEKCRTGKVRPDELKGSTLTITSLGREGGILATPILNHPEVAIVGVHAITTRPVWKDGEWVPREKMNLSFSFDHRVIDGHIGAAFAQTVIRYLEEPSLMLLEGI